ncbi:MAG TPA: hypothetical protein DD379_26415, partial [Cyanobacteria bacterium UBA11162]|nr:hypothetical protein [Cyanobacteria bacterium UBA11162]
GGGQAIADNIREPMEQAMGADFSGVKVHTDGQSHQLNQSIQARAFTTGQDIFFRQGEYDPGSRGGQELLAHELTHVVQQNGNAVQRSHTPEIQQKKGSITQKELFQAKPLAETFQWGTTNTTESTLPNGQRQHIHRMPFTQVISRAEIPDSKTEEGQVEQEKPIFVGTVISPEQIESSSLDSINSTVTHVPSVARGGAGPSGFGVTRSQIRFTNVTITPSTGTFTVTGDLVHDITWQVRSGTGPSGQIDIQDENDSDITAGNYQQVARDLTPNMSSDNGRPPRTNFWAEDLTIRHELFHARNQREASFGPQCTTAAQTWLNAQTAASAADIQNTLLRQALTEGIRVFNALVAAPTTEGDAYGDGAPLYRSRANAIKTKGDAGGY